MSRRARQQEVVEEVPPPPTKSDSFRNYLNDGAVLESLTRLIVTLYEKQPFPENPVEFLKQFVGSPQGVDYESLKQENEELKADVEKLEKRLQELKTQLGVSD